jgi:GNAT superfamily N-acetyltransferase
MSDDLEDISRPEPLQPEHDLVCLAPASAGASRKEASPCAFDSGVPALDEWLRRRARQNQETGASRTYVISRRGQVVGYYALANGAVTQAEATGRTRRNMPEPIPVMVLGRLAIDKRLQERGIGRALLRDAVLRTMQAAEIAGIRAVLVHAISEDAKRFYERCGFQASSMDPMTLMITLRDAAEALALRADQG